MRTALNRVFALTVVASVVANLILSSSPRRAVATAVSLLATVASDAPV